MADTSGFCVSCGIEVDIFTVVQAGREVRMCVNCGAEVPGGDAPASDEPAPAASPQHVGSSPGGLAPPIDVAIVSEDTKLLRTLISDIMLDRGLAKEVIGTANGRECLTAYTAQRLQNRQVGLVVLDVNMPVLNGINTAVAIRGVERGLTPEQKTPLLFFTVRLCDKNFKKVLKFTSPSMYINKGGSQAPMVLEERVEHIVSKLLDERLQPAPDAPDAIGPGTAEYLAGSDGSSSFTPEGGV